MTPTAADLRAAFDAPEPLTLGLVVELMLLDAETLDLLPRAAEVVEAAADERAKVELPAAASRPTACIRSRTPSAS